MQYSTTSITHIGREDPFIDRNYGSGLSFALGQTRTVPDDLAAKLLRHVDIFKKAEAHAPVLVPVPLPEPEKPVIELDDTQAQLQAAAEKQAIEDAKLNERQNMVDQINAMDKNALKDYAQTKYRLVLPKNTSVEALRSQVVGMIDRFGAV